ncbi:MAG: putative transcriptional regulator [Myxococcota bacterium]|jgi:predicted transcriptional regulator
MADSEFRSGGWTFLSNHAHVVICLARRPDAVLREVAAEIGITERAVHNIVSDLEDSGALTRRRDGRRNKYTIHPDRPLRHPVESHCTVGELIAMVEKPST